MSTDTTLRIESTNSIATEQIGIRLGENAKGGEVIELASDLGGGKTTLVRGMAYGMGSKDTVASPSFTVSRIYQSNKKRPVGPDELFLYHFDFYRLHDASLISHELSDVLDDKHNVVVLEWAGIVQHALPSQRLRISIEKSGNDSREITMHCPSELEYLVKGLK